MSALSYLPPDTALNTANGRKEGNQIVESCKKIVEIIHLDAFEWALKSLRKKKKGLIIRPTSQRGVYIDIINSSKYSDGGESLRKRFTYRLWLGAASPFSVRVTN